MVFADARYGKYDKIKKLPPWIVAYLDNNHRDLSTDRAVSVCKQFLRDMGQPRSLKDEIGVTMYDRKQTEAYLRKHGIDITMSDEYI
eukprot:jgi/Bigna1/140639/aug1.57_g15347